MSTNGDPIRLLLVDDEEDFRRAAVSALERRGIEVIEAASGRAALAQLDRLRPDLVLLDLRMDDLDGLDTLAEIRRRDKTLPVMILTGHGGFDDAEMGLDLQIVDFLRKPIDLGQLAVRIRTLLRSGATGPLQERPLEALIVPVTAYARLYEDATVAQLVETLYEASRSLAKSRLAEGGRRSVLIYDHQERFLGVLRLEDVLRASVPTFLRDTPYASFFTGTFLAQAKVMGGQPLGELLQPDQPLDVSAPLIEAAVRMVREHRINLPVLRGEELLGLVRDRDLFFELVRATVLSAPLPVAE